MNRRPGLVWAAATVALAVARALEMSLDMGSTGGTIDWASAAFIVGLTGAAAIHAGIIVWLARRSRLQDPARVYALIAIGVGFVIVNNVEAVVFDIAPAWSLAGLGLLSAAVHAVVAFGVTRLVPSRSDVPLAGAFVHRSVPRLTIGFILLGILYAIIYFMAGAVIYPFVQDFYANKPLPPGWLIFALQAFFRGPLFVAIGVFVVRLVGPNRRAAAAATACTLSGLGGLTALLVPTPLFPDIVRLVHLAEVGISNFVYGLVVGSVLSRLLNSERRSMGVDVAGGQAV